MTAVLPSAVRTELSSGATLGNGMPTVDPEDVAQAVPDSVRRRPEVVSVPGWLAPGWSVVQYTPPPRPRRTRGPARPVGDDHPCPGVRLRRHDRPGMDRRGPAGTVRTTPVGSAHRRCRRTTEFAAAAISRPLNPRLLRSQRGPAALAGLAPIGRGDPSWLTRLADGFTAGRDWLDHPAARMVAFDIVSGKRVAFGAPGAPAVSPATALRASWSVPGWMPPVSAHGGTYIDGGAASTASLDLLADHGFDEIYLIAPMASLDRARVPASEDSWKTAACAGR